MNALATIRRLLGLRPPEGRLLHPKAQLARDWDRCQRQARERLGEAFIVPEHFREYRPDRMGALRQMTAEIQGWFSHESGSMLYYLARERLPAPTIVELGSWKGRSTVWLAAAAADRGDTRVFAVDCWDGRGWPGYAPLLAGYRPGRLYDEFLQNLARAGVREIVTPIVGLTLEAARAWAQGPIGLLFIDADHAYAAVRGDLEAWGPAVALGGYVVLDDVGVWEGPTRLSLEILRHPVTPYRLVGSSPGQAVLQRL